MRLIGRLLLGCALAWLPLADASAAVVQITVKDAGGTTRSFNVTTNSDLTGNLDWNNVICDQAAGTTCASVGTAGSPSTNALTVQAVTLGHGTAANAMRVELPTDGTGLVNAAQSGTWNITNVSGTVSLPTGASTAAKQPALGTAGSASVDVLTVQGIASMTPLLATLSGTNNINNISGTISLPTLASTSTKQSDGSQKTQIVDGSGNVIAATSNSLNVQCANCSGSGVSTADGAAFTAGSSVFVGVGGEFTTGGAGACSTTKQCMAAITASRGIFSDMNTWAETSLGVPTAYGTAPTTGNYIGVNAFVTNTNANGRATAANGSPVVPVAAASTAGAIVPNNTTAVVVKASAGTLFGLQVYGINAAPAYVKIYNATSATCGSGTPVKRIMIPAASTAANGAGSNVTFGPGLALGTGITYCVTTGIADNDTTAPTASNFLVNVDYE